MRKGISAFVIATIACLLLAAGAAAQAPAPKVLVFHGTPDATVTAGLGAIEALGTSNGFDVDATENAAAFTAENLAQYDVVIFLCTTGDVLDAADRRGLAVGEEEGVEAAALGDLRELLPVGDVTQAVDGGVLRTPGRGVVSRREGEEVDVHGG